MNFFLKNLLENNKINNITDLKNILNKYKYINMLENNKFLILTLKKNIGNLKKIEYNSYFTIISKNPFRIINTYSDYVYQNNDCINLLCKYKLLDYKFNIYELYDGKLITMFYFNDKWNYLSSKSIDNDDNMNQLNSMLDLPLLINNLNENIIYTFVLIKSDLINIIDYSNRYGKEYNKVIHISSKLDNIFLDITDKPLKKFNIQYRNNIKDFSLLNQDSINKLNSRGLEINIIVDNINYVFLIESKEYIFEYKLKPNSNKYISFIRLYQQNLLKFHLYKYKENLVINNLKYPHENFNTYEVLNSSFEILSIELFELFKKVWDINDTSHKDTILYNFLPTEYKVILYRIKGIYFQNRQDGNINSKNEYLETNHIFEYLKIIEIELLLKIFLIRRKIKHILEKKNIAISIIESFKDISQKSSKKKQKMIAIFTNYLYPEIKKIEI